MDGRPVGRGWERAVLALCLVTVTLAIGACGFQPRGHVGAVGRLSDPIAIRGVRVNSPLYRELRRQIDAAGGTLAETVTEDTAQLRLSRRSSDSRVLSVDDRNKAVEFELEESVRFSLRGRDGTERLPAQTVRVLRLLYRPSDTVLGGDREEALLRADMRRDLAQRIVRRIASAP